MPFERESSLPAPKGELVWTVFILACIGVAGSLWLSLRMGLKACPLCFYQRSFVMGAAAVLAVGLLAGRPHRGILNLLALPMVVAGLGVAIFHVCLEFGGKLECPNGVFGIGTAPQQSLAIFLALTFAIGTSIQRSRRSGERVGLMTMAGVVIGSLLAWGSIASAPPLPQAPTTAYDKPLDICRPPFKG